MQKRIGSVVPIYILGLVWVVYGLLFPLYRITDLFIAAILSIAAFLLAKRVFKGSTVTVPEKVSIEKTGNPEADTMIAKGGDFIKKLDDLNIKIPDEKLSLQINRLKEVSKQIFQHISKNPGKARQLNSFVDYYVPTSVKLLESYAEISDNKVVTQNMHDTTAKIKSAMDSIEQVFNKQLNSLFADTALDISTDIDVLKQISSRDGVSSAISIDKSTGGSL